MLAANTGERFSAACLAGYAFSAVGVRDGREDFEAFVAGVLDGDRGVG